MTACMNGGGGSRGGVRRGEETARSKLPHCCPRQEIEDEHDRWAGDTAVKGPVVEFLDGQPVNFPEHHD